MSWNWAALSPDEEQEVLAAADMGSLHHADPAMLGFYCSLDADAAWQGWEVLSAAAGPMLLAFHQREFMTLVRLMVEQQARGLAVDKQRLDSHSSELEQRTQAAMEAFLSHPRVAPHIAAYNKEVRAAWIAAEPARTTKAGGESVRWQQWKARDPELTGVGYFNTNSKQQLGWLLYEQVFKVDRENTKLAVVDIDGKKFEFEKTPSGQRSVKKQILPLFGEIGAHLVTYNKLTKEAGYVAAAKALAEIRPTIHPSMNSVGTVTGRPAGGNTDDE